MRVDLSQEEMPIAFMSKPLLDRNVAFLIYVLDKGFKIKTNNQSLRFLMHQRINTLTQQI